MMLYPTGDPCDSQTVAYSVLSNYFKVPQFALDMPPWNNERSCEYFANELKQMVSFVEEQTNRKLDLDKLKEALEYSNCISEYLVKIEELQKLIPCPIPSRGRLAASVALQALAGRPQLTEWYRKYYELIKERVQKGDASIAQQKIRLAWIANEVTYDTRLEDWLEGKYGAIRVVSLLDNYPNEPMETTSLEKIYKSIAHKTMNHPMGKHGRGSAESYIKTCIALCQDYKIDAVIYAGNVGCKYSWATAQLVKDRIYDELGIPTLCFDLDSVDPRIASTESIRIKFETFFDTLAI